MANPITPYMGVELPVPGETGALGVEAPGKSWMELQNTGFQTMDAHDHTDGKGLPVPVLGINIDRDLPINAFNLVDVRTTRFSSLGVQPALASDIRCAYFYNNDFWVNDAIGNKIRITTNGNISGTSGSITGLAAPAAVTWNSVAKIFDFTEDTNKRAGIYCGPVSIHEQVTGGKKITVKTPTSLAADYNLVLPTNLPGATLPLTISAVGQLAAAGSLTLPNGLTATGTSGAPGVIGTGGTGAVGVRGQGDGSGPGVQGTGGATAGAVGVLGTGGSAGGTGISGVGGNAGGVGVSGTGVGSSSGVEGLGGDTGGAGVKGTGSSAGGFGVYGIGTGASAGVKGAGGPTDGVGGEFSGGGTNGRGLTSIGYGNGVAAEFSSGDGGAAPLRLVPMASNPSGTMTEGQMWITGTSPNRYLRVYLAGQARDIVGPF